jgi:nucleoid DNA-binding protein
MIFRYLERDERMTKKERNQFEMICGSDIYRIIRDTLKESGYDKKITTEEVKAIIDTYTNILYTCLVRGIRVALPNVGEFYRDHIKGRKAGYYKVPSSRDAHTAFDKNMVWTEEYMEQAPDFGKIRFVEFPRVKKQFRADTEGKL